MTRTYRRYDPRLKNLVVESGDIDRFARLGIPKSTLREWIHKGHQEFVTDQISMTITQIDIEFSNSMIDMLFHRLKHRYLFTFPLTSFETLVKAANFFFTESNTVIPHSALRGGTPAEVIMGEWTTEKIAELQAKIKSAMHSRVEANLALQCPRCPV